MASSMVSMANKLKLMVDQVKIQTEAIKDSAITQAKIQAENEKLEVRLAILCVCLFFVCFKQDAFVIVKVGVCAIRYTI